MKREELNRVVRAYCLRDKSAETHCCACPHFVGHGQPCYAADGEGRVPWHADWSGALCIKFVAAALGVTADVPSA